MSWDNKKILAQLTVECDQSRAQFRDLVCRLSGETIYRRLTELIELTHRPPSEDEDMGERLSSHAELIGLLSVVVQELSRRETA